jgi:hypothetical protein
MQKKFTAGGLAPIGRTVYLYFRNCPMRYNKSESTTLIKIEVASGK